MRAGRPGARNTSRTFPANSSGLNGFWRKWAPALSRWWDAMVSSVYPDMNRAFIPGHLFDRRATNSGPLVCGITTSVTTRWMCACSRSQMRSASPALAACITRYPYRFNMATV